MEVEVDEREDADEHAGEHILVDGFAARMPQSAIRPQLSIQT